MFWGKQAFGMNAYLYREVDEEEEKGERVID